MHIRYVDEVKKALGDDKLAALTAIFCQSKGLPPAVEKYRFRADHPKMMTLLDELCSENIFLELDRNCRNYRVKIYSLPLINNSHAVKLIKEMEHAFSEFKNYYDKYLDTPLTFYEAIDLIGIDDEDKAMEMFCYMMDAYGWIWGRSIEFPFGDNPSMTVAEDVLNYNNFGDILNQVYERHLIKSPKGRTTDNFLTALITSDGFFSINDTLSKPKWYELLDDTKKDLILEIDKALHSGMSALPAMGLRALIDLVLVEKVGDKGSFFEKLDVFQSKGFLSIQERESLNIVLELGNAASHRAHFPDKTDLQTCVDVIKHMLHGVYDLHPKTELLANKTPARPKKISS